MTEADLRTAYGDAFWCTAPGLCGLILPPTEAAGSSSTNVELTWGTTKPERVIGALVVIGTSAEALPAQLALFERHWGKAVVVDTGNSIKQTLRYPARGVEVEASDHEIVISLGKP